MLIIDYGSFAYFLYLLATAGIIAAFFFLFRKQSAETKTTVLFILMLINVLQHLLKHYIWPNKWDSGFGLENTFYNVCAFNILISPFVLLSKNNLLKQYISYFGGFGAALALFIPQWFIGESLFMWEFARFWFCHSLLVCTSVLPILWKLTKFHYKDFWKFGLMFFLMMILIIFNDIVCVCTGLYGSTETLYENLYDLNPLWAFHPPAGFSSLINALTVLTPDIFLGAGSGIYTPVLWYAVPMYLIITLLAFIFGSIFDKETFLHDIHALSARIRVRTSDTPQKNKFL